MDEVIYLLKNQPGKNDMGDPTNKIEEIKRYAKIRSIGQKEAYQAAAVGLKPEFIATIWKFEYENEEYLKYKGKEYKIQKTYIREDERIELTCSSKVNNEENAYGST